MKTSVRFNNAIAALVNGYLKGTLMKGSCQACAVGNIVAAGLKDSISIRDNFATWHRSGLATWYNVFVTPDDVTPQEQNPDHYAGVAKIEIDSTGYTWQELALVESAFEKATKIWGCYYGCHTPEQIDADQLSGLYAVVDVLCDIEGIGDAAPYKAQFDRSLPL